MNTTVSSLPQEGSRGCYRLRIEWVDDSFNILLLQNGSAWSGHAPAFETGERMLDSLLQHCSQLKTKIIDLQEANDRTTKERKILIEKLVEYKKQKLQMEGDLISRFLAVLGTKKEYINHLEERLTGNNDITQENANINGPKAKQSKQQDMVKPVKKDNDSSHYDTDTEFEEDTDDEKEVSFVSSANVTAVTGDLFEDTGIKVSMSNIPLHKSRPKRTFEKTIPNSTPGPSTRKLPRQTLDNGQKFNTQNLLDDF